MSYAGVESEYDYAERILRERDRARYEQSYEGRKARHDREVEQAREQLASARASLKSYLKEIPVQTARMEQRIKDLQATLRRVREDKSW